MQQHWRDGAADARPWVGAQVGQWLDKGFRQSIESVLGWLTERSPEVGDTLSKTPPTETAEEFRERLRAKLKEHMSSGARPRLVDLQGKPLTPEDFPLTGDALSPRAALAILERLEQRIKNHPSAGQLMACVLEHLRYCVGIGDRLSPTQVRLIKSICTLTNLRPIPFLRVKDFILSNLDSPDTLRRLLGALLDDRERYLDRLRDAVRAQISPLGLSASRRVAVLGYATSMTVILDELAKASNGKMHVYVASALRPGRRLAAHQALQLALSRSDVEYALLDDAAVRTGRFDLVLAGSKVISVTPGGELEMINSASYVGLMKDLRAAAPGARIAVATGLFKIWPQRFYEQHRETALKRERSGAALANASLPGNIADFLVSELGWLSPEAFVRYWKVGRLLRAEDAPLFGQVLAAEDEGTAPAVPAVGTGQVAEVPAPEPASRRAERAWVLEPRPLADEAAREGYAHAAARFKERMKDAEWRAKHEGKFVAISGTSLDEIVGGDYLEVLANARLQWPGSPVFARRVDSAGKSPEAAQSQEPRA